MLYQVVVTVRVHARDEKEAEREALKAIVGDLSRWSEGAIRVECRPIANGPQNPPDPPGEA
jgi:hypothetical protein